MSETIPSRFFVLWPYVVVRYSMNCLSVENGQHGIIAFLLSFTASRILDTAVFNCFEYG